MSFEAVRSVGKPYILFNERVQKLYSRVHFVLHAFGRPLKQNPHIHCLISEGGHSNDGEWRNIPHFNYKLLRESFCTVLLNELEANLGPSFKCIKAQMYKLHDQGFYVYTKTTLADPKTLTKYIGRYLGRPVIATKQIDDYKKEEDTVTFHYNCHEDNKYVEKTFPAIEFIKMLMQHIPEKQFQNDSILRNLCKTS